MFTRETSIEIHHNGHVQSAQGKVAIQGFGMSVYSFFVDGLLIDTGSNSLAQEFQSFFSPLSIEQIALTHSHEDHAGNVAWLQQQKDVPIYLHRDSLTRCETVGDYPMYRQALWGSVQHLLLSRLVLHCKQRQQFGMSLKHLVTQRIM